MAGGPGRRRRHLARHWHDDAGGDQRPGHADSGIGPYLANQGTKSSVVCFAVRQMENVTTFLTNVLARSKVGLCVFLKIHYCLKGEKRFWGSK